MMVVGTIDLSHVPAVVQGNQVDNAKKYQQLLAQKLPAALAQIGAAKVSYFDHVAFSDKCAPTPTPTITGTSGTPPCGQRRFNRGDAGLYGKSVYGV